MSSNFFFNCEGSERGQYESSWWQKITFSSTDFETPSKLGISSAIFAHFVEIVFLYDNRQRGLRESGSDLPFH